MCLIVLSKVLRYLLKLCCVLCSQLYVVTLLYTLDKRQTLRIRILNLVHSFVKFTVLMHSRLKIAFFHLFLCTNNRANWMRLQTLLGVSFCVFEA